jgi:hypothetical protein
LTDVFIETYKLWANETDPLKKKHLAEKLDELAKIKPKRLSAYKHWIKERI